VSLIRKFYRQQVAFKLDVFEKKTIYKIILGPPNAATG
jgi:hypothetical protein